MKWGAPRLGAGAEVTYGYAGAPQDFPDAINCRSLAPMGTLARAWERDSRLLDRTVDLAFGMWSGNANLRFRRVRSGERPDILIGAQGEPRRIAFANVWHDAASGAAGVSRLTRATICLNPQLPWRAEGVPGGGFDLKTVLAHEIGHAIGLDHPGARGALMGYQNQGDIDQLMPGDIAGALALYGPRAAPGR